MKAQEGKKLVLTFVQIADVIIHSERGYAEIDAARRMRSIHHDSFNSELCIDDARDLKQLKSIQQQTFLSTTATR
jgi:hypothetical protein